MIESKKYDLFDLDYIEYMIDSKIPSSTKIMQ